jgi:RHS repeat-associated protein
VNQRTTSGVTKTTTYILDYAGNTTQVTYPTGRVVNYSYDSADRPSTAADGSNGITYATGFQTSPGGTCIANVTCYTPQGTFYALSIGQSSTFTNGLNLTHKYNARLQPLEFQASSSGGNAIDITYSFTDPSAGGNAGHVFSITNNLDSTRSQAFVYDQLNRITSAQTTSTYSTSPAHCWGETYSLDAWGNLNSLAATTNSNYTGCTEESGFSTTADGNNHLPIFSYDPSGNTQNDSTISYTWDGESQLKSATNNGTTTNYTYDGAGRRASKVGGKLYWYGSGGEILAETDASGNTLNEYIFFGGKRIAMLPAGGNPIYYVEDLLGTSRVITSNAGVVCYDADFYPYGGERAYTNTCPQNYKFEGKERDTETGNDDFGARYYSNRFGRWLSADWSSVPVPVPYANLTNPQTLNLYSMVADDPESFADLDGHERLGIPRASVMVSMNGAEEQLNILGQAMSEDPVKEFENELAAEYAAEQQQTGQQQAANSLTVLGNTVDITYDSHLTEAQKLTASDKLSHAAASLNEHADELTKAQKKAIGEVHSIDVVGPNQANLGISGNKVTLSTSYLAASSVAWTASVFAHEGTHKVLSGKYTGENSWRSEQEASRVQIQVGRVVGMQQREIWHLMWWSADFHKAEMQAHMAGYTY